MSYNERVYQLMTDAVNDITVDIAGLPESGYLNAEMLTAKVKLHDARNEALRNLAILTGSHNIIL